MAEPLTQIQEPGFFSQVKESPNLFLAPATINVIGLIGEGKATKSVTSTVTRGAGTLDDLTSSVVSSSTVYSNGVFKYPASSYGFAVEGTTGVTAGATGLALNVAVAGVTQGMTFAAGFTSAVAVAAAINAVWGVTGPQNIIASNNGANLVLATLDGQALEVDAGTANTALALTEGEVASNIYWDPAITDEELAPQAGTDYSVDMETPKETADYGVKFFTSATEVYTEYGDPVLGNSISLGAFASFNAPGASVLACRQLNPANYTSIVTRRAEIVASLKDMEAADIDVLVPMIPCYGGDIGDPLTIPLYLQHVSKMSSKLERKERLAILGVDEIDAVIPLLGTGSWTSIMENLDVPISSGLAAKRIVMLAPGVGSALVGNSSLAVDGTYLAAGFAGRIVAAEFDTATPMTRKTIATVESLDIPERLRTEKNALTGMGVTVIEMKNGIAMIRRAVTADTASIASQEPSIVRAFDQIASELRAFLENRFVGSKILPNVTSTVLEAATQTYLNGKVAAEIIGGYRSIKAVQNKTEPRQFDISFEAIPIFPFLWGMIDLSVSIE